MALGLSKYFISPHICLSILLIITDSKLITQFNCTHYYSQEGQNIIYYKVRPRQFSIIKMSPVLRSCICHSWINNLKKKNLALLFLWNLSRFDPDDILLLALLLHSSSVLNVSISSWKWYCQLFQAWKVCRHVNFYENGMLAIVMWENREKQLHVATPHLSHLSHIDNNMFWTIFQHVHVLYKICHHGQIQTF